MLSSIIELCMLGDSVPIDTVGKLFSLISIFLSTRESISYSSREISLLSSKIFELFNFNFISLQYFF